MELTINNKTQNAMLKRIDIQGTLSFKAATPSNAELTSAIAKKLKVEETNVVIKQIATKFSTKSAEFKAVAYDSVEARKKYEVMTKHQKAAEEKRKKEEAEKKAAELEAKKKAQEEAKAAAQAAKEEKAAPAEEKSE